MKSQIQSICLHSHCWCWKYFNKYIQPTVNCKVIYKLIICVTSPAKVSVKLNMCPPLYMLLQILKWIRTILLRRAALLSYVFYCFSHRWQGVDLFAQLCQSSYRFTLEVGSGFGSSLCLGSTFKDCQTWECWSFGSISGSSAHEKLSPSNPSMSSKVLVSCVIF